MRFVAILILITVNQDLILADTKYTNQDENYGKTWMYFPDGDDIPQITYLNESTSQSRNDERIRPVKDNVHFELYTRRNRGEPRRTQIRRRRGDDSLDQFNYFYNSDVPTKILVHGWKSSTKSDTIQNMKNGYLSNVDCNVIAVDWSTLSSNNIYPIPARQTRDVGRYIAELIDYLCTERGSNVKNFHIVGHSLGAHIAGFAGYYTKAGKIPRITGLDPARPLFESETGPEGSLDKSDADFVDIIHTSAGTLGYRNPLGHCDFYPNGGKAHQPGCKNMMQEIMEACSHGRSHHFFAESLITKKGFIAYPCASYDDYEKGKCTDNAIIMGEQTPIAASGVYYLKTLDKPPYAMG